MASVRADIHTIRDYERFLKARGFSHKEAKHLASLSKPFFDGALLTKAPVVLGGEQ